MVPEVCDILVLIFVISHNRRIVVLKTFSDVMTKEKDNSLQTECTEDRKLSQLMERFSHTVLQRLFGKVLVL